MQEMLEQYRVVVGNQTVVFNKENDPTILLAPSTGKLIKFLVADGSHIEAGEPYAEMEVMKMITTLHNNEVSHRFLVHVYNENNIKLLTLLKILNF